MHSIETNVIQLGFSYAIRRKHFFGEGYKLIVPFKNSIRRIKWFLLSHAQRRKVVSLRWGSHREEYALESHVLDEIQIDDLSTSASVQDPILAEIIHRHVFESRYMYWLRDASFDSASGNVFIRGQIVSESYPETYSQLRMSKSPTLKYSNSNKIVWGIRPCTYYHWMLEEFPALIKGIRMEPDLEIWHHRGVPNYIRESTKLLGFEVNTTRGTIKAGRLLLLDRGNDSGWPHPENISEIRRFVNSHLKPTKPTGQIYISRLGSQRESKNELEIEDLAHGYGYEVIRLHEIPWIEQLQRFRNAEIVLAAHGAGLANVIAMHPGAQVREVMSTQYANPVYNFLCEQLELQYEAHTGNLDDLEFWASVFRRNGNGFAFDLTPVF